MKRLPSEKALAGSIDYSIQSLVRMGLHAGDLLRRRRFDAGRDGYPVTSLGGGGGSGGLPSSSTELAALAPPISDPVGRYIDDALDCLAEVDRLMQRASNCLAHVLSVDQEIRGRVSSIKECECCAAAITGLGDDRRRSGFCPACFKAWMRWRPTAEDPTARGLFISWRRDKLKVSA